MQDNGNVKKYLELNDKYVKDAEECLVKGDYAQASEKLWGATVTVAKAIAAQRRKTIKIHEGIGAFLAQIARELKDGTVSNVYFTAEALHQNFYENAAPPDFVKKGAKTIPFVIYINPKRRMTCHQFKTLPIKSTQDLIKL